MEADPFVETALRLTRAGDWRTLVESLHDDRRRTRLLWVFPSADNLRFLRRVSDDRAGARVVSVGCGSGLLEWILTTSVGLDVTCVEIDGAWWNSGYAPPAFRPLRFAKAPLEDDAPTRLLLSDETAILLFCYFNDRRAFLDYLRYFAGRTLIIIGPGEGRGAHADPMPLEPGLGEEWRFAGCQEVRHSKDFIAVYDRRD